MIFQFFVFGLTTHFWDSFKFEGSRVIFKYLAVDRWFCSGDRETLLLYFLDEAISGMTSLVDSLRLMN